MTAMKPYVDDTRPEGHSSLALLPRLDVDEYDRLQGFYGFEHLTQYGYDGVGNGQLYFQLFLIELKAGVAVVQPKVFDLYEGEADGVLMWESWPNAPLLEEAYPPYKSRGVHCWTDGSGSCGWPYSGNGYIIEGEGGPFTVWANAGDGKHGNVKGSDALDKIGWWDDHITPNPWFQVAVKGGEGPPPITGDAYLVDLAGDGETVLKHIRWVEGAPVEDNGYGFLAFMQDGEVLLHIPWEGQG